ncbi:hypothetical protein ABBQ32_002726 [Trebouxia sp. C0010 RCD-2024]
MNIEPSEEQTQSVSPAERSFKQFAQHGQQHSGAQPHLNPLATSFQPGAVAKTQSEQRKGGQHLAQEAFQQGPYGRTKQTGGDGGGGRGRGSGHEGGLSRALQGGRHSSAHADKAAAYGRGRGRTHDHLSRGRSQPSLVPPRGSDPSPQDFQSPDSFVGGPEQSPLGRSPSNRTYSSANHLLNFQYDSYANYGRDSRGRGGGDSRGRGGFRRQAPKPMPYNRNKFLQANFRFLVSDAGSLKKHEADADLMLDWDDVLQVVMMTGGEVQCPISLETNPLCPQITPCGHVFAFHSIMQHLMTQGGEELRKAARCPLCYSMVAARELKLVQVLRIHVPQVNDTVTFTLLKRPRDSIIPAEVHPSPDPDMTPTQDNKPPGMETSHASWGTDKGHKEGTHRLGDKSLKGDKSKEVRNIRNKQGNKMTDQYGGTGFDKYAKFTRVGDGKAFWKAAAEELASYAAQLTAEGGWDAAQEAPFLYAAMDALASRAGSWAERQQRIRIEGATPQAAADMAEPVVAARQAVDFVKQFSTAAVHAAEEQQEAASNEAHRQALFPTLSSSSTPVKPGPQNLAAGSGPRPRLTPLVRLPEKGSSTSSPGPGPAEATAFEAAFSDSDEGEGQLKGSRGAETAVATAEGQDADLPQSAEAVSSSAAAAPDHVTDSTTTAGGGLSQGSGQPPSTEFFFYQSADGQCVFLHPLVSRALLAHHGSYAACPPQVIGKVLEVEDMVQTDATRKRMKHLAHLPISGMQGLALVAGQVSTFWGSGWHFRFRLLPGTARTASVHCVKPYSTWKFQV